MQHTVEAVGELRVGDLGDVTLDERGTLRDGVNKWRHTVYLETRRVSRSAPDVHPDLNAIAFPVCLTDLDPSRTGSRCGTRSI
jgi:hypothetical protein